MVSAMKNNDKKPTIQWIKIIYISGVIFILSTGIVAYMSISETSNFEYENDIQITPERFRWKTRLNKNNQNK